MKGAFETNPTFPSESKIVTWDPQRMLDFLEPWFPHDTFTLEELTLKLTFFLAILSGQRSQTFHALDINNMAVSNERYVFFCNKLLKHSRRSLHRNPVGFLAFPDNKIFSTVNMLKEYLSRTKDIRSKNHFTELLISYQSPYRPVSKDTIRGWIKHIMEMTGINVEIFTPHSSRAASTSYVINQGVPIRAMLRAAGWSQESTFVKFYKKETKSNFGLNSCCFCPRIKFLKTT